jgi:hypothetical protein
VSALVRLFALLDRLPTRALTACFVAVGARREVEVEAIEAGLAPVSST